MEQAGAGVDLVFTPSSVPMQHGVRVSWGKTGQCQVLRGSGPGDGGKEREIALHPLDCDAPKLRRLGIVLESIARFEGLMLIRIRWVEFGNWMASLPMARLRSPGLITPGVE